MLLRLSFVVHGLWLATLANATLADFDDELPHLRHSVTLHRRNDINKLSLEGNWIDISSDNETDYDEISEAEAIAFPAENYTQNGWLRNKNLRILPLGGMSNLDCVHSYTVLKLLTDMRRLNHVRIRKL